jgi:nucleotide-binding universal stress UspA family protein
MRKPILVGYDPRADDRAPVRFGVTAARLTGAPLIIASVCAKGSEWDRFSGQLEHDLVTEPTRALEQLRTEFAGDGRTAACRVVESVSAARGLHEAAEAEDAGLLVVGSTRRATLGRVLPGSTADRLAHGAPCPIAVVPAHWQGTDRLATIGVAYVDTPEGREALRGAHALARRASAVLRVLTVVKVHLEMYRDIEPQIAARRGKTLEHVEGEHRAVAESAARAAVAELGGAVEVEVDAFVDDVAETLIRVSEHLDLLVCGSRGYGPLHAVLLGGVSRRVAAEAYCPVIILPRGVEASLERLTAQTPDAVAAST